MPSPLSTLPLSATPALESGSPSAPSSPSLPASDPVPIWTGPMRLPVPVPSPLALPTLHGAHCHSTYIPCTLPHCSKISSHATTAILHARGQRSEIQVHRSDPKAPAASPRTGLRTLSLRPCFFTLRATCHQWPWKPNLPQPSDVSALIGPWSHAGQPLAASLIPFPTRPIQLDPLAVPRHI